LTSHKDNIRVAAIQASPLFLDRDGCVEKAIQLIRQAAGRGVSLAAFGEGWLPGYPIHALQPPNSTLWWELAADYLDQAIEIPGPATDALAGAAREVGIDVVIGVSERDPITRGSVYATSLFISAEGEILGRHRKLRPALSERAVWADGDAIDLHVHDRGYACVSALNGCEHQMVLPTYALAEQGTQIHVACWPGGETRSPHAPLSQQHLLSRAFAFQTGAYVLCVAGLLMKDSVPPKYREFLAQDYSGDSMIIDPRGEIVVGPVAGENMLIADCSLALIRAAKVAFDCAGHAARKDQFRLSTPAMQDEDAARSDELGQGPNSDQEQFDMGLSSTHYRE
jgi:predicted amidohydrolase